MSLDRERANEGFWGHSDDRQLAELSFMRLAHQYRQPVRVYQWNENQTDDALRWTFVSEFVGDATLNGHREEIRDGLMRGQLNIIDTIPIPKERPLDVDKKEYLG